MPETSGESAAESVGKTASLSSINVKTYAPTDTPPRPDAGEPCSLRHLSWLPRLVRDNAMGVRNASHDRGKRRQARFRSSHAHASGCRNSRIDCPWPDATSPILCVMGERRAISATLRSRAPSFAETLWTVAGSVT